MSEFRADVRNTTIKQILNLLDGLDEMVDERLARNEMQMVRSQSADVGSGLLTGGVGGVGDLNIFLTNMESLRQAINDGIDAATLVAKGAKPVHHDYEELTINRYTGNTTDDTTGTTSDE